MKSQAPDPIDIEVGRTIRGLRKLCQMSQTQVGEAIGVTFQQFRKYESGQNRISASMLVRTARVLGVPPADLLPKVDATQRFDDALLSPSRDAIKLLQAYGAISSPQRRKAFLKLAIALGRAENISRST